MNMKRHLSLALTLGVCMAVAGCDDGFLTTEPQDAIPTETFWRTERDFTVAVNAVYRNILNTDQFYMEGATDLAYSQKDWTPNHAFAQGIQDASHGWSNGIWGRLYQGIS